MIVQFAKTSICMVERKMPDETKLLTPADEEIKERIARKSRRNLTKKQSEIKIDNLKKKK